MSRRQGQSIPDRDSFLMAGPHLHIIGTCVIRAIEVENPVDMGMRDLWRRPKQLTSV
jgi:hypothetical protein